jgi:hypothetical protein
MKKTYRFKTKEEFIADNLWVKEKNIPEGGYPYGWNDVGDMNCYLGQEIPSQYHKAVKYKQIFYMHDWEFKPTDYLIEEELTIKESLKQMKSLITKEKMKKVNTKKAAKIEIIKDSITEKFVFMDKTVSILNVGFQTGKNVVLFGSGGHGKSELTLEFFAQKEISPYVITMGTGMTTDRLFGGLDIPTFEKTGKIEYLVENSFMNHEYVIFEEMFDAPDFILEQLKDILSSKTFRNGTQVFPIKTKFIVCCTNRTRDEFSKNMSLKALMERFPLELNVIWDNYTEISYNKLLESKFGEGEVDPIIPFLLQEYTKNGITISPRVAVNAYEVYQQCGPESLTFIAEFSKKPALIKEAIKKFEGIYKFNTLSSEIGELMNSITENPQLNSDDDERLAEEVSLLKAKIVEIKSITITDDTASKHAQIVKVASDFYKNIEKKASIKSIIVED